MRNVAISETYYISLFYHLCRSSTSPEMITVKSDQRSGNYSDIFHFWIEKKKSHCILLLRHYKEQLHTLQSSSKYTSLKAQTLSFHFCFHHLCELHIQAVSILCPLILFSGIHLMVNANVYSQSKSDTPTRHQVHHFNVYLESVHNIVVHGWVETVTGL